MIAGATAELLAPWPDRPDLQAESVKGVDPGGAVNTSCKNLSPSPEVGDIMGRALLLETPGSTAEPVRNLFDDLQLEAAGGTIEFRGC